MKCLRMISICTALAASTPAFAYCDPTSIGYRNCLYNETLHGQNPAPSGSISSHPNPLGGYDYSNGVSSRPNPSGGYNYSNGVTCRPNPLGGMDCRR